MSNTILVADDSQIVREMLQMNLTALGYTVVLAEDGERAIERIAAQHPDLLIVDVMMPKMNGFQICRRVKSDPATRDTPVILLTARVQQEDIFWGKDCGADEYITKPFKSRDLEATVARLLESRRGRQAAHGSSLATERQRRLDQGEDCQVVAFSWDPQAMDIFRKKYGEIRFSEALEELRVAALAFMRSRRETGPVGVQPLSGLRALISGAPPQALKVAEDLAAHLNACALALYEAEDRERGHISHRNQRTGSEERHPLLSFAAQIEPDTVH